MIKIYYRLLTFILFSSLSLLTSKLDAQIFSETTFDQASLVADGDTPDDALWYETINVGGNHRNWVFNGTAYLKKENGAPGDRVEAYLISPQLTLKQGNNNLTYSQTISANEASVEFEIRISTTTRDISNFSTIHSYTGSAADFTATVDVDLSDFSGETVYLAFVRILPDVQGKDWTLTSIVVDGSDVLEADDFIISSVQDTEIGMYWAKNTNDNDVMVAFSTDGIFGDPVDGTTYDAITNNSIVGGGTVLYVGSGIYSEGTPFNHSGLSEFTPYYYKIWSLDGSTNYSYSGIELNATTTGAETVLYADFEDETGDNADWTKDIGGWTGDQWIFGNATTYRGSQSAYITSDGGTTASYQSETFSPFYLSKSITIPAGQYKSLELSFFWKSGGNTGKDYGEVYWDGTAAGNLISNAQEFGNQYTWTEKTIDLTDHVDLTGGGTYTLYYSWASAWASSPNNPGFCIDDVRITGRTVARPENFTASVSGTSDVQLTWTPDNPSDDVLVAYSSSGTFGDPLIGDPVKGTSYTDGDFLPGGGEVIYKGKNAAYLHTNVSSGVAYYKAWTVGTGNTYSVGVSASTSMPVTLPFNEDFESDAVAFTFSSNQYHSWEQGRATKNAGSKSAYVSIDNGLTASYNHSTPVDEIDLILPVNFKGFKSANISFKWLCDGLVGTHFGKVYIDGVDADGTTYQSQPSTWQDGDIDVALAQLGDVSEIQFRMRSNGAGGSDPGFCIDDISITGSIYGTSNFTATNGNTNANNLTWDNYNSGELDEVLIVSQELSSGNVSDVLSSGTNYSEGDILGNGATVIYIGTGSSYIHSSLKLNTRYAYKIWHKSGTTYSDDADAQTANATTPLNVGFFEDFEDDGSGYKYAWNISASDGKSNQFIQGTPGNITPFSGGEVMFVSDDATNSSYSKGGGVISFDLNETIDLSGFSSAYLSFYSLAGGGASNNGFGTVKINGNGLTETTIISSVHSDASWTKREVDISAYLANTPISLKFEWDASGNSATQPSWNIDNIAITGAYDDNSTLTIPADISGRVSEISSLSNTEAGASMFMNFDISDAGSGDGKATVVNGMTIALDGASTISDLTDVLSGAYIKENGGSILAHATVYSTSLVFQQEDMISVADGTSTTYELYLYLKPTMSINGDNETIILNLTKDDLVAYNGSGFTSGTSQTITNNAPIDVDISQFHFSTQPSQYNPINSPLLITPEVCAVDVNNNLDKDYQGTVTLTNDLGLNSTGNVDNNASKNGVAIFPSYTYTEVGGPAVITASDGTYSGTFQPVYFSNFCTPVMTANNNIITLVNIVDVDNYTGADGLNVAYYLDQASNLTRNVNYTLTVGITATGGESIKAWIDWDQDTNLTNGTFTEEYDLGTASGGAEIKQVSITVPATATIGGTRMRVMVSSDSGLTSCDPGTGADGETEDYTIIVTNNQWLGLTPTWDVTTNWSSGIAPASGENVTIASDLSGSFYPIITDNLSIGDFDIESGARVTVNEGVQLTVGNLTNNGTLVLKSRYDNMSSFISNSEAGIGQTQSVMYFPANRYWYTGHIVNGASSDDYNAADIANSKVYRYNGAWVRISDNSTNFTEPLEGYAVGFTSAKTIQHEGVLNGGNYSRSLGSGWRLVANPFPSSVDLDLERTAPGTHWDFTNISKTVYIRTTIGTERVVATYQIDNPGAAVNGGSRYIAPMQAFWVVASSSANIGINSSARVHNGASFKSGMVNSDKILKVALENEYTRDELALNFTDYGSHLKIVDDAVKRIENNPRIPYLYVIKETSNIAIGYYEDITSNQTIDLYNKVGTEGSGDMHLKALNINSYDPLVDVWLEDKATDSWVNLRETPEYHFNAAETTGEQRFSLHLSKVATDIPMQEGNSDSVMLLLTENSKLSVTCNWSTKAKSIKIYSIEGRELFRDQFDGKHFETNLSLPSGIYIVKIYSNNKNFESKIHIK